MACLHCVLPVTQNGAHRGDTSANSYEGLSQCLVKFKIRRRVLVVRAHQFKSERDSFGEELKQKIANLS